MMNNKVVITGISGCIGSILYNNLRDKWELSGIARHHSNNYPVQIADICDRDRMIDSIHGAYAVIHLAANPSVSASWNDIAGPNITGTEAVFEASRLAGVRKILFASSNHVTGMYEREEPYCRIVAGDYESVDYSRVLQINHTFPVKPDSYYGVSKVFGEALGKYYSEKYHMQVICIRIGTVNRENRPLDFRQYATLFRHNDLVKMVDICLNNNDISYGIFYGVSNNKWKFWDISHINECLHWSPEEDAESLR